MDTIQGPHWDNSKEYASLEAEELQQELEHITTLTGQIKDKATAFAEQMESAESLDATTSDTLLEQARAASKLYYEAVPLLANVMTFATCELSIDGKNDAAKTIVARTQAMWAALAQAIQPVSLFLTRAGEDFFERYLDHDDTRPERFQIEQDRTLKDTLLSLKEEDLMLGLSVNGITAWGNLYDNLSGEISCTVDLPDGEQTMGLAQAAALAESPDPATRQAGYRSIQAAWKQHETTCAAMLNALSGWRRDVCEKRSHTQPVHFLDRPAFDGRITRETLDCMMS
ncbi:MAG: hypothetical protein AAF492_23450, partial [Verrucomicrobiota bacterium]